MIEAAEAINLAEMGQRAKAAAVELARLTTEQKKRRLTRRLPTRWKPIASPSLPSMPRTSKTLVLPEPTRCTSATGLIWNGVWRV